MEVVINVSSLVKVILNIIARYYGISDFIIREYIAVFTLKFQFLHFYFMALYIDFLFFSTYKSIAKVNIKIVC